MKTYRFRFTADAAEFHEHFVSVKYNMRLGPIAREDRECTLNEAIAHLPEFSASVPGPHRATFRLANPRDRAPAGYSKSVTHWDKREES